MAALPKGFLEMVPLEEERKKMLIAALDDQPIYSIRLNPFKQVGMPLEKAVPWATNASYIKERPSFIEDPLFHAGAYYSQEASSMAIEQFLKNKVSNGQIVLDLCAAPGGKSTHLLSIIPSDTLLVSNEVIKSRSWILKENIDKWGVSNVLVSNNDPEDFSQLVGLFDVIVVDAPCSGEGMFRKDVNAREEWSAHNVNLCAGRQQRIIADIWPALKAGGILVFSTCTFNRKENEDTLAWLREQYEVEGIELDLEHLPGVIQTEESGLFGYRFFPGLVQGEGFFMAGVVKQEGKSEYKYPKSFRKLSVSTKKESLEFDFTDQCKIQRGQNIHYFPEAFKKEYALFDHHLKLIKVGTEIGEELGKKMKYSPELAFSAQANLAGVEKIPLDRINALRFLSKKEMDNIPLPKSWALVTYKNLPLGWIKNAGGRINNYYPKEFRIRKNLDGI